MKIRPELSELGPSFVKEKERQIKKLRRINTIEVKSRIVLRSSVFTSRSMRWDKHLKD